MAIVDRRIQGMSITPYTPSGEIDEQALRKHLRYMAGGNIGVYMGAFTSGEGHLLTDAEVRRIYEIAAHELAGKVPAYAARLGYAATQTIIKEANEAGRIGLQGAMIYPPAPGDPGAAVTPDELERFYYEILDGVKTGVFLSLHAGKSPGVKVPIEFVTKLVGQYDHILGVHVINPDPEYVKGVIATLGKRTAVRVAGSRGTLECLAGGVAGFISFEPNIAPKLCGSIMSKWDAGDQKGAAAAFEHMTKLSQALGRNMMPRSLKASLNELGFNVGACRHPYLPATAAQKADLAQALKDLDIRKHEGL